MQVNQVKRGKGRLLYKAKLQTKFAKFAKATSISVSMLSCKILKEPLTLERPSWVRMGVPQQLISSTIDRFGASHLLLHGLICCADVVEEVIYLAHDVSSSAMRRLGLAQQSKSFLHLLLGLFEQVMGSSELLSGTLKPLPGRRLGEVGFVL